MERISNNILGNSKNKTPLKKEKENFYNGDYFMLKRKNNKKEPVKIGNEVFNLDRSDLSNVDTRIFFAINYLFNKTNEKKITINKNLFIKDYVKSLYQDHLTKEEKDKRLLDTASRIMTFQSIKRTNKETEIINVFEKIRIPKDSDYMEIEATKSWQEILSAYQEAFFTIYNFNELEMFQSKYEQNLYLYLKQFQSQKTIYVYPPELKKRIGAKETETASHIKRLLDKAKKDFKKYNIFPNFDYKIEKEDAYTEGFKYSKIIKRYIFILDKIEAKQTEQKEDEEKKSNPNKIKTEKEWQKDARTAEYKEKHNIPGYEELTPEQQAEIDAVRAENDPGAEYDYYDDEITQDDLI